VLEDHHCVLRGGLVGRKNDFGWCEGWNAIPERGVGFDPLDCPLEGKHHPPNLEDIHRRIAVPSLPLELHARHLINEIAELRRVLLDVVDHLHQHPRKIAVVQPVRWQPPCLAVLVIVRRHQRCALPLRCATPLVGLTNLGRIYQPKWDRLRQDAV
jgi:hypothetical protein